MGEPSVDSVNNEDVETLSNDASSGASLLEPVVKKRKVEKSIRKELMDRRTHLDKQTQDTVVSKRKCKDKSKDKENGHVQHKRGPYKGLRISTPQGSGAPKPSNARTPSSTLQDSVNWNPSMSPNETSMLPGLNMTTTSLSKPADARPPPLLDPWRKLSRKL